MKNASLVRRARCGSHAKLDSRVHLYSSTGLAALATGAAVVGVTATASAQIVTTTNALGFTMTAPSDGKFATFTFGAVRVSFHGQLHPHSVSNVFSGKLQINTGGAGARTFIGTNAGKILKLGAGANIPAQSFAHPGNFAFETGRNNLVGQSARGSFAPAANGSVTGYIGFKEVLGGHSYFGWLHIKVQADGNGRPIAIHLTPGPNTGGVTGAYENITNGSLTVGAIPEPASVAGGLALFALGAAGVREFRKRRQVAAVTPEV